MDSSQTLLTQLTAENPMWFPERSTRHRKSVSKTANDDYYFPKKMTQWKDFNYTNLCSLYEGSASEKLNEPRSRPLPEIIVQDLKIHDERGIRTIYDTWNRQVVCRGLDTFKHELHPCTWANTIGYLDPLLEAGLDSASVAAITLKCLPTTKSKSRRRKEIGVTDALQYKRYHDVGSGIYCKTCSEPVDFERMPKDYKFAKSWRSSWIREKNLVDDDGNWIKQKGNKAVAWAIRQVYTYCVDHLCRYGVILTNEEAFIFRIQPAGSPPTSEKDSPEYLRELRRQLVDDGILEYVSVAYSKHWGSAEDNTGELTINLALWYLHVLAGNDHRISWSLGDLASERLRNCLGSRYHTPPPPNVDLVLSPEGRFVPARPANEDTQSSHPSTATETTYNLRHKRKAKETGGNPHSAHSRTEYSLSTSSVGQEPGRMRSDTVDALRDAQIAVSSPKKRKKAAQSVEQETSDNEFPDIQQPTGRKRRAREDYSTSFISGRSSFGSWPSEASSPNTTQPNTQTL